MNYIEALEKAIILLIDNPNISDEAGGYSDCGIVDNDKEIAETLQQLRNQMEQEKEKIKKDYNEGELLSTCCGWSPASEPVGDNGNKEDDIIALCSKCKDWSGFEYETEEE